MARTYQFLNLLPLLVLSIQFLGADGVGFDGCITKLGAVKEPKLSEISGLNVSSINPDTVWLVDDGKSETIFATSFHGKVKCEIKFDGKVKDIEDLSFAESPQGDSYIIVSDSGDNDNERDYVQLLAIKEPILDPKRKFKLKVTPSFKAKIYYPDKAHDFEALVWDPNSGDFFLFSKEKKHSKVFKVSGKKFWGGNPSLMASSVCRIPFQSVSAADISRDGKWIILRNEKLGAIWNLSRAPMQYVLKGRPFARVAVRGEDQGSNGESIGFIPSASAYITVSEGANQPLYLFKIAQSR